MKREVGKVIVGQTELIEGIIIALLSDGHILLEGYPGLGKTVTVKTGARVLDATFQRGHFTPDLIPGDITGFEMWDPETRKSRIQRGPVFTNLLLADEINRISNGIIKFGYWLLEFIWLLACLREAPPPKALCGGQALRRRQVLGIW